jgi:ribonucleoside-diphosphate reductase alpha subunit
MKKNEDYVIKRNGKREVISFDKILKRIKMLGENKLNVNYTSLSVKIIDRLYPDIPTSLIDELTAQQCASLATSHPDYGILASKVMISNHHKNTDTSFFKIVKQLYQFKDVNGNNHPLVAKKFFSVVRNNKTLIQGWFDFDRDYLLDYFGFKTLERAYLMRINGTILERPQHMWMRVAIGIHGNDLKKAKETYDYMSQKYFTHATPTLFNAGTPRSQLSSCYLIAMEDDSISGIYSTLADCANISKWAGGIGLHIHNVRASGSHIRGTNGTSNGIVPMLRVFNSTARYCDQGGGKRKGSFAIYMEPWHGDIEAFLDMKKNHGDEEMRARDLFYAMWIPDLFMQRVIENKKWTLMCPDHCPGLSDVYGDKFKALYEKYENEGMGIKEMPARKIWLKILDSQIETGTPYILFKDHANHKTNQKNLGTIKSSNLCCEIMEYSNNKETAVCNLASIGLSKFVEKPSPDHEKYKYIENIKLYAKDNCGFCRRSKTFLQAHGFDFDVIDLNDDDKRKAFYEDVNQKEKLMDDDKINSMPQIYVNNTRIGGYTELRNLLKPTYNFEMLHKITKIVTHNLNKVIDINFYPTKKTDTSNKKHRPIGIGVQGLADAFVLMEYPFDSEESKLLNKNIFETIYHAALEESVSMAIEDTPYSTFEGSPASKGILQFDMWNVTPSNRYKWKSLKDKIKKYGLRNSLLVAPMPTASTSQILGNNECFEPFTSNIYVRRTLAGEFIIVNKYLIRELIEYYEWNDEIKNSIVKENGSIQHLKNLPKHIRDKYKIVWEMPMKTLIDMSADRGAYICQSQSLNLWMKEPKYDKLTSMHVYSWRKGLKTGIYYLRTKAKAAPQQFTIEPENKKIIDNQDDDDICEMCSG